MKCDVNGGSIVDEIREPTVLSFILDIPAVYKVFCEPETIHYKTINKSVFNSTTFCLEKDNNEEVNFNGEALIFTLRLIKIWTIKWAFKNSKKNSFCLRGRHYSSTANIVGDTIINKKFVIEKKIYCFW